MVVDETACLGLGRKGTAVPCPCSVNAHAIDCIRSAIEELKSGL